MSNKGSHYDVIIIGARVAGAATALCLARSGLKVLVVDRQMRGSDTLSTHALMRGGVQLLNRWGLFEPLLAEGTPLITATSFHYGEEEITIELRADDAVPGLMAPRRFLLDHMLVAAAEAAGAEFRHRTALRAVLSAPRGRVVGVTLEDPGGNRSDHRASIVVGADGIGSTLARLVNAPVIATGSHSSANLYGYVPRRENDRYRWYYGRGVAAGVIPTNGGMSCVFASVPTGDFDARHHRAPAAAYADILRRVDARLADETGIPTALSLFRGRPGFVRGAHGPGWALVGDAGFFRDPLTAHGMTDALRDAEALAAAILRGSEYDLRRYQSERDTIAMPMLATTDRIVSFDWHFDELRRLHRSLSETMKAEWRRSLTGRARRSRCKPEGLGSRYRQ